MFRLIKKENGEVTVLKASESESKILDYLCVAVIDHASNGDEYTPRDLENLREAKSEQVGPVVYAVDEVQKLTDSEIVKLGGGICAHCHSSETSDGDLAMQPSYVERIIDCDICGEETVEQYILNGIE